MYRGRRFSGKRIKVRPNLPVCCLEVAPGALLFHKEHAQPEQIGEAHPIVQFLHMLFVPHDGATLFQDHRLTSPFARNLSSALSYRCPIENLNFGQELGQSVGPGAF